ncbi:MAG: PEP/pyruvate-binding domain-containing protein [Eubacteriales bacterium]|jgi:pyruvate,water dikinase
MAAFGRVESGIPEMDSCLHNIRLGDNVVWRVSDLDEFHLFLDPFVDQAIRDHRNLIYVRFASHPPFLTPRPGLKIVSIELSHRFENFTVEIHNLIEREGFDAFYVFDCLSELQTAWSTDLMMGNFFRVTCPYLFSLNTVAYFPLIRGKHSFQAIAKIRDTAQLFLDVYSEKQSPVVYVRPEKVWRRYSETMFLPHVYEPENGSFSPILDGVRASHFYQVMNRSQRGGVDQNTDAWDRFFNLTRSMHEQGMDVTDACSRMCNIMMSRDERLRVLIKKHFQPEDYFDVRDHMIGTGMIGGKACGMLLARKLVADENSELASRFEPHDSYYIGSDVFYSYIVENGCWDLRVRQRTEKEYFSLAKPFAEKIMAGKFPEELEEQFIHLLEYYGQDPIIVRSSSILEDGFGNAFAGKYESVFCANNGTMEERLEEFTHAVRVVYASTMSLSALEYRRQRGLDKRDEQMAILIQRVSGSHYGRYYMPCAAGVGYSYSPYRVMKNIDPSAGMLRLVMGLGISAVDRTEGSYPRLVNLDRPEAVTAVTSAEKHRYSQRGIEVINKETKQIEQIELKDIEDKLPWYLKNLLLEHDTSAERILRERGERRDICFISCAGLVKKRELMNDMRSMLHLLQENYGCPVDTEFTVNLSQSGEYVINLLQCRPLQVFSDSQEVRIPTDIPEERVLFETKGSSMGLSRDTEIDRIVFVDPKAYYQLPYKDKTLIAKAVGTVNWVSRGQKLHMILMVPGRIGTSSPELGVPTTFSDISAFGAICEIADSAAGYNPELSYGSHIFQDLVEAGILYTAIFENEHTVAWHPERLQRLTNHIAEYVSGDGLPSDKGGDTLPHAPAGGAADRQICVTSEEEMRKIESVIGVYDLSGTGSHLYNDMNQERVVCLLGS